MQPVAPLLDRTSTLAPATGRPHVEAQLAHDTRAQPCGVAVERRHAEPTHTIDAALPRSPPAARLRAPAAAWEPDASWGTAAPAFLLGLCLVAPTLAAALMWDGVLRASNLFCGASRRGQQILRARLDNLALRAILFSPQATVNESSVPSQANTAADVLSEEAMARLLDLGDDEPWLRPFDEEGVLAELAKASSSAPTTNSSQVPTQVCAPRDASMDSVMARTRLSPLSASVLQLDVDDVASPDAPFSEASVTADAHHQIFAAATTRGRSLSRDVDERRDDAPRATAPRRARTPSPRSLVLTPQRFTSPIGSLPSLSPPSSGGASDDDDDDFFTNPRGPRVHLHSDGSALDQLSWSSLEAGAVTASPLPNPGALRDGAARTPCSTHFEVTDPYAVAGLLQATLGARLAERARPAGQSQKRVGHPNLSPAVPVAQRVTEGWDKAFAPDVKLLERYYGVSSGRGRGQPNAASLRQQMGRISVQRAVRNLFGGGRALLATVIARQTRGDVAWAKQLATLADADTVQDLRRTLNAGVGSSLRLNGHVLLLPPPSFESRRYVWLGAGDAGTLSVEVGALYPRGASLRNAHGWPGFVDVSGPTFIGARLQVPRPRRGAAPIELRDLWLASNAVSLGDENDYISVESPLAETPPEPKWRPFCA